MAATQFSRVVLSSGRGAWFRDPMRQRRRIVGVAVYITICVHLYRDGLQLQVQRPKKSWAGA